MSTVQNQYQNAYSAQYSSMTAFWRELGAEQKAKNIQRIAKNIQANSVLEVGAGDGSVLAWLSKNNFVKEYHALEISDSGLEQIQAKNINGLASAQLFDGYHVPFADKSIDLLVLTHVLEHVEHERLLLREIFRVAKHVVIEVPKDYRYGVHKKLKHFLNYGHINVYTPSSLQFLLGTEGFEIIDSMELLYAPETFVFGKTGLDKKKGQFTYLFKSFMVNVMPKYIAHKFVNTITILAKPLAEKPQIM
jgi:ubiquinone/menaquinone biosynthesis C-methylase UbiE